MAMYTINSRQSHELRQKAPSVIDMEMEVDMEEEDSTDDHHGVLLQLQRLQQALHYNVEFATSLQQQIEHLHIELLRNYEKQRLIKAEERREEWRKFSKQRRCTFVRREKFFAAPYFAIHESSSSNAKSMKVCEPPANMDSKYWSQKCGIPIFHSDRPVLRNEKSIIVGSVRSEYIAQAKTRLLSQSIAGMRTSSVAENDALRLRLRVVDGCCAIDVNNDLLDWHRITTNLITKHVDKLYDDVSLVKGRTASEYETIWKNFILCDNRAFSESETQCLLSVIEEHGGHNWIQIHAEFVREMLALRDADDAILDNMQRTCLSIYRHCQKNINVLLTRGDWNRRDDEILLAVSKEYGENDNMSQSFYMDRRLPHQCTSRLQQANGSQRIEWSMNDDLYLLIAVHALMRSDPSSSTSPSPSSPTAASSSDLLQLCAPWSKVREFVVSKPSKNDAQCRDRYTSYLHSSTQHSSPAHHRRVTLNHSYNVCEYAVQRMNAEQAIYIVGMLMCHKERMWANWSEISFVLNGYERKNWWSPLYKRWRAQITGHSSSVRSPKPKKSPTRYKYPKLLTELQKHKLTHSTYFEAASIAYFCVIVFGGLSAQHNRLFNDETFCRHLYHLLTCLREYAVEYQMEAFEQTTTHQQQQQQITAKQHGLMHEIKSLQQQIEALIDDPLFVFDRFIQDVVHDTVYFVSDIDSIQSYKYCHSS